MDVAVTGSSGMIGSALREVLAAAGHRVVRVVRSVPGADEIAWDVNGYTIDAGGLEGIDAVVHLAGEPIAAKIRWTDAHRTRVLESRVRGTRLLSETLAGLSRPPRTLISASAVGYYGDRGEEHLPESAGPGTGFLAEVCIAWEEAARPAAEAGVRVVHTRSALVLSERGGVLQRLLLPFRLGVGGPLGTGKQWWSWILLADQIGAIVHLLDAPLHGPVNLAAPEPVRNATFARTLGRVLHRPAVLPIPSFALRLVAGAEAARELLGGQRIVGERLSGSGFRFRHPELEPALRDLLGRHRPAP